MAGDGGNRDEVRAFAAELERAGLLRYLPVLKGGTGAVRLQHVLLLKEQARLGPQALEEALARAGVEDGGDRRKLAGLLMARLEARGGMQLKPLETPAAPAESAAWREELGGAGGALHEDAGDPREVARDEERTGGVGEAGEIWPPGMKIVNPQLAHSIRAQGMIQEPNRYGYVHLAAEIERPGLFRRRSADKEQLLRAVKEAAAALREVAGVRRADVFDAFIIPPGSKEGRRVLERGQYDIHAAEFDVVVLVECDDPETAARARDTTPFAAVARLLEGEASFTHCITAKNAKRIAEVDKERDGVFLFNYFFAADIEDKGAEGIDILLGVWEYTAGWWTAKANLTNSTPLIPLAGERSSYSLINHCRWDRARDVFPHLVFRPSLDKFVLANFTANDIVAMPILYHLA